METGKADAVSEFFPSRTKVKHQCPGPRVQARLGLGAAGPMPSTRGDRGGTCSWQRLAGSSRKKRSPGETLPEGGDKEQRMGPDPAAELGVPTDCCPRAALLLFTQLHLRRLRAPPGPESHPIAREADPPASSHCLEPGLRGPRPVPPAPHLCPQALALLSLTDTAPGFILQPSSPRGSDGCVSWESLRWKGRDD